MYGSAPPGPHRRPRLVVYILSYYKYFRPSKKSFVLLKIWLEARRLTAILLLAGPSRDPKKLVPLALKTAFRMWNSCQRSNYCSNSSNICSPSSLKRSREINKNAISTRWTIAKVRQKLYYDFIALVFLVCLILSAVGRFIQKLTNTSLQNITLHEA